MQAAGVGAPERSREPPSLPMFDPVVDRNNETIRPFRRSGVAPLSNAIRLDHIRSGSDQIFASGRIHLRSSTPPTHSPHNKRAGSKTGSKIGYQQGYRHRPQYPSDRRSGPPFHSHVWARLVPAVEIMACPVAIWAQGVTPRRRVDPYQGSPPHHHVGAHHHHHHHHHSLVSDVLRVPAR